MMVMVLAEIMEMIDSMPMGAIMMVMMVSDLDANRLMIHLFVNHRPMVMMIMVSMMAIMIVGLVMRFIVGLVMRFMVWLVMRLMPFIATTP